MHMRQNIIKPQNSINAPLRPGLAGRSRARASWRAGQSDSGKLGKSATAGGARLRASFNHCDRFAVLSEDECACCPVV
eukprot:2555057-Alexandrium_andersonii.AAC.1